MFLSSLSDSPDSRAMSSVRETSNAEPRAFLLRASDAPRIFEPVEAAFFVEAASSEAITSRVSEVSDMRPARSATSSPLSFSALMSLVRLRAISRTALKSSSNSATTLLLPESIFSAAAISPRDWKFATLASERMLRDILDAIIHAIPMAMAAKIAPAKTILRVSVSVCPDRSARPSLNSRSSVMVPTSQLHGL